MISIIVPIYNSEKYLDRCIASIINQTYDDFELLLIDDGSPDKSYSICEIWAKNDERVRYLRKENGGVSSARNLGLRNAKGELITFIDSDDWVEAEYLEVLLCGIECEDIDISCCNYTSAKDEIDKSLEKNLSSKKLSKKEALDCYSEYYFTSVWAKLYKKEILSGLFFDEALKYSEDTLFYTEAVLRATSVYWNNRALYNYYININGAMRCVDYNSGITDYFARKKIVQIMENANCDRELVEKATCRVVGSALAIMWQTKREKQTDSRIDELKKYIMKNKKHYLFNREISLKYKLVLLLCILQIIGDYK